MFSFSNHDAISSAQGHCVCVLNYSYLCICSQGIDTCDTRKVSTTVPIDQIPDLMRALGFYPSEQEVSSLN